MKTWEEYYKNTKDIWGITPEYTLEQYGSIVQEGKVLDLGIGEGRNIVEFAVKGHEIVGVDMSETALERCKNMLNEIGCKYSLHKASIQDFDLEKDTYSLIVSTWALNFMKKSEALSVIKKSLTALNSKGILYLGVFSTEDPQMKIYKENCECVDTDSYFVKDRNQVKSYFNLNDITTLINEDFDLICRKQDLSLDIGHGDEHFHGAIELVIRKK